MIRKLIAAGSVVMTALVALGVGSYIQGGKVIEGARPRVGRPTAQLGSTFSGQGWIRAKYKFSEDGGAVGAINLLAGAYIPAGAVIVNSFVDVIVAPTSGGAATIAISVEGANDIVNAAAISGAPWSTTGRKNALPLTGTSSVKTTAARNIVATVAVAALTAGEFDVWLEVLETA